MSQKAWGLKTDNTLWVWGQNVEGQMGLNDQVNRSSPTQIPGTDWGREIYLANAQTFFIKEF